MRLLHVLHVYGELSAGTCHTYIVHDYTHAYACACRYFNTCDAYLPLDWAPMNFGLRMRLRASRNQVVIMTGTNDLGKNAGPQTVCEECRACAHARVFTPVPCCLSWIVISTRKDVRMRLSEPRKGVWEQAWSGGPRPRLCVLIRSRVVQLVPVWCRDVGCPPMTPRPRERLCLIHVVRIRRTKYIHAHAHAL